MTPPSIADVLSRAADGWIEWNGRKAAPVAPDTLVEILLRCERDGEEYEDAALPAVDVEWRHARPKGDLDVVAYRVVSK